MVKANNIKPTPFLEKKVQMIVSDQVVYFKQELLAKTKEAVQPIDQPCDSVKATIVLVAR